jgi:hypothetical protein
MKYLIRPVYLREALMSYVELRTLGLQFHLWSRSKHIVSMDQRLEAITPTEFQHPRPDLTEVGCNHTVPTDQPASNMTERQAAPLSNLGNI